MLALRGRAVLLFSLLVGMFAFAGSASAADPTLTPGDDQMFAAPTGVVDVLANDSGSGSSFAVVSNTQPTHGQATCSTLGACFYKAAQGFTGTDSFTYTARGDDGAEGTATVNVNAGQSTASAALIARDDDVATPLDSAKQFNALANDTGDGITLVDNGAPKHGTVTCQADGTCNYTPNQGYSGSDGFVYTIQESGSQRTASAAVHILVAPAGSGYKLTVGGSPVSPSNGAIPPGGKANWALNVLSIPDGISGQELAAFPAPEGSGSLGGPHALTSGSLKTAKGWSGTVGGDGRLNYKAGSDALLGSAYTQTFPKPLPPISQGTGGDGHVPILVGSKVFAFFHHSSPTSATCVDRATGEVCPGYPKLLQNNGGPGFDSTDNNGPGVVQGNKIWVHLLVPGSQTVSIGLFCWDASTDSTCGYTIVDRESGGSANGSAPIRGGDGNAWFAADTGKAYCVDPSTGATCGSIDTPLPKTFSSYDSVGHGSHVYFSRESDRNVTCIDTSKRALCDGWSQAQTFDNSAWNLVNRHAPNGDANGICVFFGQNGTCMPDDDPSADARTAVNNFVHFEPHYSGSEEAEVGARTLVGSLDQTGVGCYDWSTPTGGNPGAPCTGGDYGTNGAPPGWINHQTDGSALPQRGAYGVVSDGSCAIALGDRGQVYTVDPAGSAPCVSLGSGTDRTTLDLRDQRCDGTIGSAAWRNVALSDTDGNEMDSVVVTVRDARTGEVLKSGEMIGGDQTLDLSGVNAAQHPSITIDATAKSKSGNEAWSDGIPPRIRVNWKSDPQTTCLQTTGDGACGPSAATVTVAGALANGSGSEANLSLLRNACAGGVKGEQAKSCGGERLFNIHLRFKGKDARKITVTVKGKQQKLLRMKPRPVFRIDLRKYARQRVVVKITIVTKKGKTLKGTRVYHPCTKKKPGRGFRF